jgi:hypothetical protein
MLRHIILVTAMLLLLYRTLCIVLQRLQYGESSVEKQQQQLCDEGSEADQLGNDSAGHQQAELLYEQRLQQEEELEVQCGGLHRR